MKKPLFLAKKSLGQNFLRSKGALQKIVEAADLKMCDVVLEAGPGEGVLTEELLKRAGKVIAVEKDDRLIPFLSQKFSSDISSGKLNLFNLDVLDFPPSGYTLVPSGYKLVANLPYYITGQFLKKFLQNVPPPSKMVLLLQKEVAKRIIANDGKNSILSISVKAYGEPKYIETVPAGAFSPAPKVDSAIILIDKISKNFFTEIKSVQPVSFLTGTVRSFALADSGGKSLAKLLKVASHPRRRESRLYDNGVDSRIRGNDRKRNLNLNEEKFFEIVKKGFSHKRKLLFSNLEIPKEEAEKISAELNIPLKARAEDLSLEEWGNLATRV